MGDLSVALQSASILLREGVEAMLVIAALAAFLRRAGAPGELKAVYFGAGLAILASVLAAIVFDVFLGGAHDDRVEAAVMLLVSALMFYMSGWLFLRQDPAAWNATLHRSANARHRRAPRCPLVPSPSSPCSGKAARPFCSFTRSPGRAAAGPPASMSDCSRHWSVCWRSTARCSGSHSACRCGRSSC
jgi:hypothetical protein